MSEQVMRILYVLPQLPYPPDRGGKIVMYHLIRGISRRHKVWIASLIHHGEDGDLQEEFREQYPETALFPAAPRWSIPRLARALISSKPYKAHRFYHRGMAAWVRRCVRENRIDVIHCQNFYTAQYVTGQEPCGRVLYKENFEAFLLQRYLETSKGGNPLFHAAARMQARRTLRYEVEVCRRFDRVLLISEVDRQRFAEHHPPAPLDVLPPGIDLKTLRPTSRESKPGRVVFTGAMDYFANVDAVEFFCSKVWPRVRAQVPQAQFFIVGQRPEDRVLAWQGREGITVTGSVKDVRPYLEEAEVYVVPLRIGGGIRLKILEAMAMGKAMVSTSVGAEGLDCRPGEDLLIADDVEAMADAVVGLLRSEDERSRLARAARAFAERRGGWDSVVERLERVYREVGRSKRVP